MVRVAEEARARLRLPIRILRREGRLGVTGKFERAMRACKDGIVLLCDQDDSWHAHKGRRVVTEFGARPDLLAAFTDAVVVDVAAHTLHGSLFGLSRVIEAQKDLVHRGGAFDVLMTRNIASDRRWRSARKRRPAC